MRSKIFAVGLLWLPLALSAASHHEPSPAFSVTPLTDRVSLLQGRGGNIVASHGPDGVLLVDSDFADMSPALREAVDTLGSGPVRYLLNTHWHGDHTGGNAALAPATTIIAHHAVRARVSSTQRRPLRDSVTPPLPRSGWPVVTFAEGLSVHFNGEEIRLRHLPGGHTDGDAVVTFSGSQVVHLGDLFFAGRFPFIDLDTGGSVAGYIRSVEQLLDTLPEQIQIVPGHGPLSTTADLRRYYDMLVSTRAWAAQRQAAGVTLEQAVAEGLPDRWDGWGDGFINAESWITTLFRGAQDGDATGR